MTFRSDAVFSEIFAAAEPVGRLILRILSAERGKKISNYERISRNVSELHNES